MWWQVPTENIRAIGLSSKQIKQEEQGRCSEKLYFQIASFEANLIPPLNTSCKMQRFFPLALALNQNGKQQNQTTATPRRNLTAFQFYFTSCWQLNIGSKSWVKLITNSNNTWKLTKAISVVPLPRKLHLLDCHYFWICYSSQTEEQPWRRTFCQSNTGD